MAALGAGLALGFLVGAQVGPIWLLCVRSTLRFGLAVGAAIGAGAAVVDTLYAAAGVAGASALLEIDALRIALGASGAGVLVWLGLRSLWTAFRIRLGGESLEEVGSPRRAFATSLAATASNPLTIALAFAGLLGYRTLRA
jgi:putative LysE/RhtB family amino acid efflux pump